MGNICSRSANKEDNFAGTGRVLGHNAAAPPPTRAPLPQKITSSTPGRVLGSPDGAPGPDDPRSAAARAAEERANAANKTGGKLASSLAAQKKQTQNQTLNSASQVERQARVADANTEARNYN